MARTQAADYAQRREEIVQKAAELYAERGFLGASIADLAQACGSAKSLVYHYYASKEDILYDVMASHLAQLRAAVDEVEQASDDAAGKLRRLARAFMRLYAGAAARHKVLLNELGNLPPARRREIIATQRALVAEVERLLVELQPALAGRSRPAAMLFFGMINWTHTWFDVKGAATPEDVADMAVDLMLGGLRRLEAQAS